MKQIALTLCLLGVLAACTPAKKAPQLADPQKFSSTVNGDPVQLYTLYAKGAHNVEEAVAKEAIIVQFSNLGARIVSILAPDNKGNYEDVTIGYSSIDGYLNNPGERYLGPVIGRYGNRIGNSQFVLDDVTYYLPQNNNGQCLHGGIAGVDMNAWKVKEADENHIVMSTFSPDGQDGFPGNVNIEVTYTLGNNNDIQISYKATTDKPTVLNLTNHAFFNLHGEGNGTILDHVMQINAKSYIPVNEVLIPTGEVASLDGSPLDFRTPTVIGERIEQDNVDLKYGKGYDHCWVVDHTQENKVELAATVVEPQSGRKLEVFTDQPGIQFYSGNFFDGKGIGKSGKPIGFREALALETQHYPDSPNQPQFPTTRLEPGQVYTHICIYQFSK